MNTVSLRNMAFAALGALASRQKGGLDRPVFIVGTGRCGSSLLSSIMRSHREVAGFPGEPNRLWHPTSYPFTERTIDSPTITENPQLFTERSLASWPNGHENRIRRTFTGFATLRGVGKQFVCKSAMTSFMIPTIRQMYPDARFIHLFRNGPSVVESFLKMDWEKLADHYESKESYRRYCASYWNQCILEIDQRSKELPDAILEFSYETLCEDPAAVLPVLAEFLGIDPGGYRFDLASIVSCNFKVGDYKSDPAWSELLALMEPGMRLKGYVTQESSISCP